jgi:hypothetical protein
VHAPSLHFLGAVQAGPLPHWHRPVVAEQPSALIDGQPEHPAPAVPQNDADGGALHVVPEQQPSEHDIPSQTQASPTQRCPMVHAGPAPQPELVSAGLVSRELESAGLVSGELESCGLVSPKLVSWRLESYGRESSTLESGGCV